MNHHNTSLTYMTTTVCGWTIKYQPGLWSFCPPLEELLSPDLTEISKLLPEDILCTLHTTTIYINKKFCYPGSKEDQLGACVHWSSQWLLENSNLPEKEGHVEIYDCWSYVAWVS